MLRLRSQCNSEIVRRRLVADGVDVAHLLTCDSFATTLLELHGDTLGAYLVLNYDQPNAICMIRAMKNVNDTAPSSTVLYRKLTALFTAVHRWVPPVICK